MVTPIWHGQIDGGRLHFDDRARFDAYATELDGKRFELVLRREVRHKSRNQRSYWHGVCIDTLADHLGYSIGYLKALLKLKFLWDGETVDKLGLPVVPSTEDLTMEQYRDLIDQTIMLAAEAGCVIPSSDFAEA